jgi:Tfp pilus assembly protein PilX
MTTMRAPRDRQRGNSLLLALVVLSALATLGSLTVVSVQSSLKTSTNDRSQTVAMYAAESGAAAAMDYLRQHLSPVKAWSRYVHPNNNPIETLGAPDLPASGALPGTPDNLFSADQNAWFSVEILNNRNDPNFNAANDNDADAQVIIRSTGHGPQGSVAIIEWEIRRTGSPPATSGPPWKGVNASDPIVLVGWHIVL